MAADELPLDDKAKRMRDLLSSFYSPEPSLAASASAKSASLDAINSTSFDPDLYMNLLVQKSNLEGLLQKHVEMAAEIKNLDTDLQMLVYENYNKFISATDTIKREWKVDTKHKFHLLDWKEVCTLINQGAAGLRPLKTMYEASEGKWMWRFPMKVVHFGGVYGMAQHLRGWWRDSSVCQIQSPDVGRDLVNGNSNARGVPFDITGNQPDFGRTVGAGNRCCS